MSDQAFWTEKLHALCLRLRGAVEASLAGAHTAAQKQRLARPVSAGAGDLTFGIDVPTEEVCTAWLGEIARERPISLLTEDAGWRHMGPQNGEAAHLADFDHGGPRIAIDPIDGTRNLMMDLRSAWTVVSFAPPGDSMPRLSDLTFGLVSELPLQSMNRYRCLQATRGEGCLLIERATKDNLRLSESTIVTDSDDRPDHGYFPFFRYDRSQAARLCAIELEFHRLLSEHEGADTHTCYDDQYISNAGQLSLLTHGTYRFVSDLRAWLAHESGESATTSKPYDSAGAILCAREAGAIVEAADGSELDFPLDATTPVSFAGWVNRATRERLRPHLNAALAKKP